MRRARGLSSSQTLREKHHGCANELPFETSVSDIVHKLSQADADGQALNGMARDSSYLRTTSKIT